MSDMSIFTTEVSLFKSATSTDPTTVTLQAFLTSRKHIAAIKMIREEKKKEVRDELKRFLPAATISGTFTRRAASAIVHYNGLVCLDFDAKENPHLTPMQMKALLAEFSEVAYAALSVGGAGVFAIIPTNCTDPTQHPALVDFLGRVLLEEGLRFDKSCKDVSRLRFISYDPEAYINPEPIVFDAVTYLLRADERRALEARPPRPLVVRKSKKRDITAEPTRDLVETYIAALEGSARDVTEDYEDWIRLGFALANEFGIEGEEYFHRISQFYPDYNRINVAKKYANLLAEGRRVRIGTFFKIMQKHGIRL